MGLLTTAFLTVLLLCTLWCFAASNRLMGAEQVDSLSNSLAASSAHVGATHVARLFEHTASEQIRPSGVDSKQ